MGATRRQGGRGLRLRTAAAVGAVAALALSGCFRVQNTRGGGGHVPSADPSIVKAGPYYYKYTTNSGGLNVPVERSTSLLGPWSGRKEALDVSTLPSWAQRDFWAPGIWAWFDGYYYLYFSARSGSNPHYIGVARSTSPFGPFEYRNRLVTHGDGVIDPDVASPGDGYLYLLYSIDHGAAGRCKGQRQIMSQRLTSPTEKAAEAPVPLLTARGSSHWEHCTVENPSHARVGNFEFLFYSGGDWEHDGDADYKIGFANCANLRVACTRIQAQGWPFGTQPFLQRPGGEDLIWEGSALKMVYHQGAAGKDERGRSFDYRSLVVSDLVADPSTFIGTE